MVRIAVDCMGGDHGVSVTVPACAEALKRWPELHLLLVGQHEALEAASQQYLSPALRQRTSIVPAADVVTMEDSIEVALRRKRDSSMRVAASAVRDGQADACVSAGNTGAWMAVSRYVLKTLDGIERPAIASGIPNQRGSATTMLDLGANVDCSAEHLLQFAVLGTAMVAALDGIQRPTVGLLNIGEESIKGNEIVKQAAELLRASPLNFIGNVEGNDIYKGTVDVVVCDGFVGNVALKTSEGLAQMLGGFIREEFSHSLLSKLSGLVAMPVLQRLKHRVDHRRYNGACLLGLRGVVVKSHGSADAYAFGFAIDRAYGAVENRMIERTAGIVASLRDSASPAAHEAAAAS